LVRAVTAAKSTLRWHMAIRVIRPHSSIDAFGLLAVATQHARARRYVNKLTLCFDLTGRACTCCAVGRYRPVVASRSVEANHRADEVAGLYPTQLSPKQSTKLASWLAAWFEGCVRARLRA
jgi:hypothetical protein